MPTDQIHFGLTKAQTALLLSSSRPAATFTAHAEPASAQTETKLIPVGICDEHNLQNQIHFTATQAKNL